MLVCSDPTLRQEEEPPLSASEEAELGDAGENVGAVLAVPSMPSATVITPPPPEPSAGEAEVESRASSAQSRSSTPSALSCDPATCPIIPGCETTIDISKGRTGLGLSIVGGCDTLLVRTRKGGPHPTSFIPLGRRRRGGEGGYNIQPGNMTFEPWE